MIGSWSNRIIEESRCHMRDRHALDMTNLDVNYVALGLGGRVASGGRIRWPGHSPGSVRFAKVTQPMRTPRIASPGGGIGRRASLRC